MKKQRTNPDEHKCAACNGTGFPAVTRPVRGLTTVSLYAFSPDSGGATMQQLFLGTAGEWVANGTNPNLVPVVANGRVFVASYKELVILGLHK